MPNFHQDPWRPGAAVQPATAAPVREDPPKLPEQPPEPETAQVPQEPANTGGESETPADDKQALQDELEKALAEMRGQA